MTQRVAIGIGCSSRATAEDLLRLIQTCVPEILPGTIVTTMDGHHCSSLGKAVSSTLGLPLMLFSSNILAHVSGTKTHSQAALERSGTPSVAEASALVSLGPTAHLILPRQIGRYCTCAVAVAP